MSFDLSSASQDLNSYDYSASSGEEFDAVLDEIPSSVKINLQLLDLEVAKLQATSASKTRVDTPRKISMSSNSDLDLESNEFELVELESSDTATVIGSILSAWFLPALWVLAKIVDTVAILHETGARMIGWIFTSDA